MRGGSGTGRSASALTLLLILVAAGCLTRNDEPGPPTAAPQGDLALAGTDCRVTLHVWLLPQDELAAKTPPEFPPSAYSAEGADTPLARLVFYLYDCADAASETGRSTLGLLGARVDAPDQVAPPSDQAWATMYVLQAWASGAPRAVLDGAAMAYEEAVSTIEIAFPAEGVSSARMSLEVGGEAVFGAEMASLPGQVEAFARPERYYLLAEDEVRWIDVDFDTTLYEAEGRVEYADGTPWADAVGSRAYDGAIDHHAMTGSYELTRGRGALG